MPPAADAVGLVDGHQAHPPRPVQPPQHLAPAPRRVRVTHPAASESRSRSLFIRATHRGHFSTVQPPQRLAPRRTMKRYGHEKQLKAGP